MNRIRTAPIVAGWMIAALSVAPPPAVQAGADEAVPSPTQEFENADELQRRWAEMNASPERYARAIRQAARIPEADCGGFDLVNAWEPIGVGIHNPDTAVGNSNHFSGRIRSAQYADGPLGEKVLHLGASGGGLWRFFGVGPVGAWEPISDSLVGSPAVGAFLVDSSDPDRILIGSGDWTRFFGDGLHRSLDGGATWHRLTGHPAPRAFFRIVADRTDPERIFAASTKGLWRNDSFGDGFWVALSNTRVTDVIQDPANAMRWLAAERGTGILESFDGGASFAAINGDGGAGLLPPLDRMSLAISPADPRFVFMIATGDGTCSASGAGCTSVKPCPLPTDVCNPVGLSKKLNGIYRSSNRGKTWQTIDSVDSINRGQAWHTCAIAVDPDNPNRLAVGLMGWQWTEKATAENVLWRRTSESGCSVENTPQTSACDLPMSHPDHTGFLFVPEEADPGNTSVVITNDGGYYLYDWTTNTIDGTGNKLGLRTSQVIQPYGTMALSYQNTSLMIAGLQDNGVVRVNPTAGQKIKFLPSPGLPFYDGGLTNISPDNTNDFFATHGAGYARMYSRDAGTNWINVNCNNKCRLADGTWTNNSCSAAAPCPPPQTCPQGGLGSRLASVIQDPFPGLFSPEIYTHDPPYTWHKGIDPNCDWQRVNPDDPLPANFDTKRVDMGINPRALVFYLTARADRRLFVLDGTDVPIEPEETFPKLVPDDRTPVFPLLQPPAWNSGDDAHVSADRSILQPETIYYTTGNLAPPQALVSRDRGQTWDDVTGDLRLLLPDARYFELIGNPGNPNQLFLATDVGVYRTDTGLDPEPTWCRYSNGLPAVTTTVGIEMGYDNSPTGRPLLYIGTFGQGFWRRDAISVWGGRIPDGGPLPERPLRIDRSVNNGPHGVALSWSPSCSPGDTDYAVYEGSLGDFSSHVPRECGTDGQTETRFAASSGSSYFLVVPVGYHDQATTEGSLGSRSDGAERPQGVQSCFPQDIGDCP